MEASLFEKGLGVLQNSHLLSPPPQIQANELSLNINIVVKELESNSKMLAV
jgi:hypothetical protein